MLQAQCRDLPLQRQLMSDANMTNSGLELMCKSATAALAGQQLALLLLGVSEDCVPGRQNATLLLWWLYSCQMQTSVPLVLS